jgi:predicted dithiol-disulfide oxidoreductase (DUF899 family)
MSANMKYADANARLLDYRRQIAAIREKMRATLASAEAHEVRDYEFTGMEGAVRLSSLFAEHDDLILIHNMGVSCPLCTLWADGYNGIHQHVVRRAAFAVTSPDAPEVQQQIARNRGWVFPMISHAGTTFAADMGYQSESGDWLPGVSVFRRDAQDRIVRVSDTSFRPGDDFCTLWHFFDLLPAGAATPAAAQSCCGHG